MTVLSSSRPRLLSWSLPVIGVILVMLPNLAHAAVDPLGTAQASVDSSLGILSTYGPVLGSMYLLYPLAARLVAKYASASWFAKGKRLALASGVLGVSFAALQAQIAGAPWNVIAVAAIAAVFKLLTPTVPPTATPTTPSKSPELPVTGKVGTLVTVLVVLGIGGSVLGSQGCGPTSTAILNAALDCTTTARKDLVDALVPTAVSAIQKIKDPRGKVNVDALRTLFSGASLNSEAGIIAACVEADAIDLLASLFPILQAAPSSQAASGADIDVVSLREALATQFPGVVFKTAR